MNRKTLLTITSLLSVALLPAHIAGDVAYGFDRGGPGLLTAIAIVFVVACGTLLLSETRVGHVLMFLGGLATLAMPIIHRNNGFTRTVAQSPGGLFFIWTLMTLGVIGGITVILAVRGFLDVTRTARRVPANISQAAGR